MNKEYKEKIKNKTGVISNENTKYKTQFFWTIKNIQSR